MRYSKQTRHFRTHTGAKKRLIITTILALSTASLLIAPVAAQSPTTQQTSKTPTPTSPRPVSAPQTGINLTLSPVFLSLITEPGEPVTSSMRVRNNNVESESLKISIAKFTAGEDGSPIIAELAQEDEFGDWVSFSEQQFRLAPNESKTIRITISPPESAALGYYYAFVISRITNEEAGQGAAVAGSPALPVLLSVSSPNAKRELEIAEFKTDRLFYEYLPAEFDVVMKNTGNIHAVPVGDIFLDWMGKKDIAVVPMNTGRGNILPETTRTFSASWDDGLVLRVPKTENGKTLTDDKGNPQYRTHFDFDRPLSKFRIGKYTANLIMIYDNGERDVPLEAQVSFWVVPVRLIMMVLAFVLAPVIITILIIRWRYGRRK